MTKPRLGQEIPILSSNRLEFKRKELYLLHHYFKNLVLVYDEALKMVDGG